MEPLEVLLFVLYPYSTGERLLRPLLAESDYGTTKSAPMMSARGRIDSRFELGAFRNKSVGQN